MKREEAKAWFKVLLKDEYAFNSADREAFEMAIQALSQEQCDDAVSRQAVLDGLRGCICDEWVKTLFATMVKQLPSVNPQPCDDAISREDAIHDVIADLEAVIGCVKADLRRLPSVTQKSKTGHWILTDDDFVYCSECEDSYYPRPIDASWYYCPHCGAKMESEVNNG